ncbi:hypothetical protein EON83_20970 [bacterium]|nr:MAG: hypothetical protein EON83_20970 [bacterium]
MSRLFPALLITISCGYHPAFAQPETLLPTATDLEKRYSIPRLTGEEILCEIETESYSGIFSIDIKHPNPLPVPLVSGAHSPQWGPKHKVFCFIRAGQVWVGDCEGRIQPAGLIPREAQNFQMFWDTSRKTYALYDQPGWTRIFARGMNFSEDLAAQRLKERKRINLRFGEKIVMRNDSTSKEQRFLEVEDGVPPKKVQLPFAAPVEATESVAFSPDARQFVMQVRDAPSSMASPNSHLWLLKTLESNVNDPGYTEEKFMKTIADNDYSRFYDEFGIIPRATFIKELTGPNKEFSESQPLWSPDGTMLAYTQTNLIQNEVWPNVLMGKDLEKDIAVTIPNYLPSATERATRKSVEVLFWGSENELFLIEGTRNKIYRGKLADKGFVASIFVEAPVGGTLTLLHPVLRGEWLAYTMPEDASMTLLLKNMRTNAERIVPLMVDNSDTGVVQALNW